jgi:hypothetical protein
MSHRHENQPSPDDPTLFDVETSVHFGSTDPSATPKPETTFIYHDPNATEAPQAASTPSIEDKEPGVSIDVRERAKTLLLMLPLIGGVAQREALPKAMHTAEAEADIVGRYGEDAGKRVNRAVKNAAEMRREAWNLMYKKLGYEALGNDSKRETSDDMTRLMTKYGAGEAKARNQFKRQLEQTVNPKPKRSRKNP